MSSISRKTKARAGILKAMAHPTRLFILEELARGERCVCDLRGMVGSDLSTVSKHLSVLKAAGLVADDRRGAQIFYTLTAPCVLKFLDCIDSAVKSSARCQLECVR